MLSEEVTYWASISVPEIVLQQLWNMVPGFLHVSRVLSLPIKTKVCILYHSSNSSILDSYSYTPKIYLGSWSNLAQSRSKVRKFRCRTHIILLLQKVPKTCHSSVRSSGLESSAWCLHLWHINLKTITKIL